MSLIVLMKSFFRSVKSRREKERLEKIFDKKHIYMRHTVGHNREFSQFVRKIYA